MKRLVNRISTAIQAVQELGLSQTFWYAVYQFGLRTGHYRRVTVHQPYPTLAYAIHSPFSCPAAADLAAVLGDHVTDLLQEADEIAAGQVRLFGGPAVPLSLAPPDVAHHWTYYEGRPETWGCEDLKFLWEPARFGWVYPLGRAFILTNNEKYPAAFWQNFEQFLQANPLNQGPNWASAQEVALRILAFLFAAAAFQNANASTPQRLQALAGAIAAHAQRIPPTLPYARAQNNNHRVSEALGLYAAGCALPDHPASPRWIKIGWAELNHALQSQIELDGTYTQHSANYHRLMLHAALQAYTFQQPFPVETARRLSAATVWLLAQMDPPSGRVPNLGSNDGANILPLAAGDFSDNRPALQAASRAFLGQAAFPPGPWDELSLWLHQKLDIQTTAPMFPTSPAIHRLGTPSSWGALRAVHFKSRPSHADQLHVDLWWRGENIALDAGTYRYTAAAPWDNTLGQTQFHNTITINGQDQMQRAGRFLWLNWAQAELLPSPESTAPAITAQHTGYLRLGVVHQRTLSQFDENHWQVTDVLFRPSAQSANDSPPVSVMLHWLLPDWPWSLKDQVLVLEPPFGGKVRLSIHPDGGAPEEYSSAELSLVRAGKALFGPQEILLTRGWASPTYSIKNPALSLAFTMTTRLPITLTSEWRLSEPDQP